MHQKNIQKSAIQASVKIRKAVYEGTAQWTIVYRKAIDVSIDDKEWLLRFQQNQEEAPPNSTLLVDLEEEGLVDENGKVIEESTFTVQKVYKVIKPPEQ